MKSGNYSTKTEICSLFLHLFPLKLWNISIFSNKSKSVNVIEVNNFLMNGSFTLLYIIYDLTFNCVPVLKDSVQNSRNFQNLKKFQNFYKILNTRHYNFIFSHTYIVRNIIKPHAHLRMKLDISLYYLWNNTSILNLIHQN